MLIDTHCHLDASEFDADRDAVHAAAVQGGVARMLVPSVTVNGISCAKSKIARYPECAYAYGIHPMYVMQTGEDDLSQLESLLEERPVAVGEIGLDGLVSDVDLAVQEYYFVEQLKLARRFELPVVLHVRRAIDPVLKHLRRIRVPGGIAHAFNGSRQQADEFIKLGFALGYGGAMTYSGSTRIRALAAELPLEALVLETDAPDIPPAWLNGGRNTPAELPRIAAILADLRGLSPAELIAATTANARRVIPGI